MINYSSVQELKNLLEENDLSMSRQRGQNFLVNGTVRRKIAAEAAKNKPGCIWEIGPGIGNLTSSLLEQTTQDSRILLFEFDYGFCRLLEKEFAAVNRIELVKGDFLKTFSNEKLAKPSCICGNLPYNVGSVIIMEILKSGLSPDSMVFMLQKEVAKRIAAQPGDPDYSAYSLHCQLEWRPKVLLSVPPGSFYPAPNVTSAVIVFEKKPGSGFPWKSEYFRLVDDIFASRRKTIRNNLKKAKIGYSPEELEAAFAACGIDCGLRAEKLATDQIRMVIETLHI